MKLKKIYKILLIKIIWYNLMIILLFQLKKLLYKKKIIKLKIY